MENEIPLEATLDVPDIVRYHGFECEEINVTTVDGFILSVFRVRDLDHLKNKTVREPVVLQHGLLGCASHWVSNGPHDSLAFILAKAGLDVYLANSRGNKYCKSHVSLKPTDQEFWRWSWQEKAKYDIPATVDAVLKKSGYPNLFYVGHSQGTLIMFAYLSEAPKEECRKIRSFFALAPITRLKHIRSPIKHLAGLADIAETGQTLMGGSEVLPNTKIGRWLNTQMHKMMRTTPLITIEDQANSFMGLITGFNPSHYFRRYLPVYTAHTPSGTSLQNLIHFCQLIKSKKMQKYDHKSANINNYLSESPPVYDLSEVHVPVLLFHASDDNLSDPEDVKWASSQLPNVVEEHLLDGWDHLDFIWGTRAPAYLYAEILAFIVSVSSMSDSTDSPPNSKSSTEN